ncbi:MAG: hypothetical protein FWD17_18090, partial [Polyangiaceae bacterium]|nr:hypothetical protein [Polyangiaceae bacterium]
MTVFLTIALVVAAMAAWTDARTGHIPNWLTLGALALGLVGHLISGWHGGGWYEGFLGLGQSAVGALLATVVPAFMYWQKAIGGG